MPTSNIVQRLMADFANGTAGAAEDTISSKSLSNSLDNSSSLSSPKFLKLLLALAANSSLCVSEHVAYRTNDASIFAHAKQQRRRHENHAHSLEKYLQCLCASGYRSGCNFYSGCIRQNVSDSIEGFIEDVANFKAMKTCHLVKCSDLLQAVTLQNPFACVQQSCGSAREHLGSLDP